MRMEDRFRELVKSAADILKEVSVQKFLSEDREYQKDVEELNEVEQAYIWNYICQRNSV